MVKENEISFILENTETINLGKHYRDYSYVNNLLFDFIRMMAVINLLIYIIVYFHID